MSVRDYRLVPELPPNEDIKLSTGRIAFLYRERWIRELNGTSLHSRSLELLFVYNTE